MQICRFLLFVFVINQMFQLSDSMSPWFAEGWLSQIGSNGLASKLYFHHFVLLQRLQHLQKLSGWVTTFEPATMSGANSIGDTIWWSRKFQSRSCVWCSLPSAWIIILDGTRSAAGGRPRFNWHCLLYQAKAPETNWPWQGVVSRAGLTC